MRKIRTCQDSVLHTGVSRCPVDFGRMKGAIILPPGKKLPDNLTLESLEKLVHADRAERAYGIVTFCEYAQEGGEAQTGSVGYGGLGVTGYSDRADTFTLDKNYPELHASLTRCAEKKWGAYFFDEKRFLYGINDGTDTLAPFPMNTIHSNATPYPTSSAKSTMTVKFCHEDSRAAIEDADFIKLDFDPRKATLGLVEVELIKDGTTGNDYKIIEKVGGFDLTSTYGALFTESASLINGSTTAVTYDEGKETLTIATTDSVKPKLKAPKVLYEAGVTGIEQL